MSREEKEEGEEEAEEVEGGRARGRRRLVLDEGQGRGSRSGAISKPLVVASPPGA